MSKKVDTKLVNKDVADLEKDIQKARQELAKAQLDATIKSSKDTNVVGKLKKKLAVLLTLASAKKFTQK